MNIHGSRLTEGTETTVAAHVVARRRGCDLSPDTFPSFRAPKFPAGFSLLEVMIGNLIGLSLLLAWWQGVMSLQVTFWNQIECRQMQVAARVTQRALELSVRQAGQNQAEAYLESPQVSELVINSDLTGDSGDPDGMLEHSFERQRFRMNPNYTGSLSGPDFDQRGNLQWKSGLGSFQPFVSHVSAIGFQLDPAPPAPKFVTAELEVRGRQFVGERLNFPTRSFQFTLQVEKNREQWFRYDLSGF
ncbi:MAG: hypothetical protein HYX74_01565 [Acidobacteria bacterium]|nr:hypothetical protein [Acidobacteriota bacterium]